MKDYTAKEKLRDCFKIGFPLAQWLERDASHPKVMGSILGIARTQKQMNSVSRFE